jgi:SSS family solute:Na+ symporter
MFGLPTVDLIVIAAYAVLMVVIGLVAMFRIKNQEDFFLGGRRFGKFLQIFSAFGQATSSDTAVGAVTTAYRDGAGGIWSQLVGLWATPLYWFTAPWYRRMRLLTLGDFFHERFRSRAMAMVYSLVASVYLILVIGLGLKAVSSTVIGITLKPKSALTSPEQVERAQALRLEALNQQSATESLNAADTAELQSLRLQRPQREFSSISESALIWFIVLIVFVYGIAGGLEAAVWTDTVQGTLILVLSILLVPFAVAKLNAAHGVSGLLAAGHTLHEELPGRFFSLLGSAANADFTWYFVVVLSVMTTLNVATQSNQLTANASAKDELTASIGFTTGTMLKRYCSVMWGFLGMLCFALYGREIQNSDLVWGHATRDLLGGLGLGLVGLMIACLLAALQSTASTLMISSSSLFTKNVYQPLRPGRSEAHYVLVGRLAGGMVLLAAALLCTSFYSILEMLKFLWEFNAIIAASFWCGLKWRRATRQGAWASMLTAMTMFVVLPLSLPTIFPQMRTSEALMRTTQQRMIPQTVAATSRDVDERSRQIAGWSGTGSRPAPLLIGEEFSRPVIVPPKSIYWAQGIGAANGVKRGEGMFYLETWLLDQVFDLSANPHALNETMRYAYKILLPFLVLIVVSLLTAPDESESVHRFFLRMRTKVRGDRAEDERAVQAAYANPETTRACLLRPQSQLEFFKWNREDVVGFSLCVLAAFAVLSLLYCLLHFGA